MDLQRSQVNLLHILVVAPLLFYVGYNRAETPEIVFNVLVVLALLVLLYHGNAYINSNSD
jgi:hypothetical protein